MDRRRFISVVTPCYNEEENVRSLYLQIRDVMQSLPGYTYEHIFIDNASRDQTVPLLRALAAEDPNVKVILNARNFGHLRSPYHGLLQASGEAVVLMASDLQDPPAMIKQFIEKWEQGFKVVLGVKTESEESPLMFAIRRLYYDFINWVAEVELTKNNTGFGLYDRRIIDILRQIDDPYPYFRGLISDIGFESAKIPFKQPARRRGITKNNFYTLYDTAMLGITYHSKVPLRVATLLGFVLSGLSFLVGIGYFIAKLLFWNQFTLGLAPLIIGMFLFSSMQLFFTGIVGEYIGSIHTQVLKRPHVIERERINFLAGHDAPHADAESQRHGVASTATAAAPLPSAP
jgi:glycosyltransferase involved in cell wall biosynthesis